MSTKVKYVNISIINNWLFSRIKRAFIKSEKIFMYCWSKYIFECLWILHSDIFKWLVLNGNFLNTWRFTRFIVAFEGVSHYTGTTVRSGGVCTDLLTARRSLGTFVNIFWKEYLKIINMTSINKKCTFS